MHISDALHDQIHESKSLLHHVAAMMGDLMLVLWSWLPEQLQTSFCCHQREDSRVGDQSMLHAHTFPLCVKKIYQTLSSNHKSAHQNGKAYSRTGTISQIDFLFFIWLFKALHKEITPFHDFWDSLSLRSC